MKSNPAPSECEIFHVANLTPCSRGANQCVKLLAQGGNPIPCTQPLIIQNVPMTQASFVEPIDSGATPQKTFVDAAKKSPIDIK